MKIRADGTNQFRIDFKGTQIDPFGIAQAIAGVMRECKVRSAAGHPLVWNEYRMILAQPDYESIRPLQAPLERDLRKVLTDEARTRKAELVGEMRVTVVPDEADELAAGGGVVRVAFVPTDKLQSPRSGELTMRFDGFAVAGEIVAKPTDTVIVADSQSFACTLRWGGSGEARLVPGATMIVGRPHPDSPPHFIALAGAGATVNKQHFWIAATGKTVRVGRYAKSNPVHVNGQLVEAGAELEVALPAEISLSRGDLVIFAKGR
ncbi:MAG TPA: FhaA domain-containing protein [Kofleriaceae bacterium]|nr:FhaA domain-containing protein [Kofleriaceae bacterium]